MPCHAWTALHLLVQQSNEFVVTVPSARYLYETSLISRGNCYSSRFSLYFLLEHTTSDRAVMAEAGNSETEADAPKPVAPALACPRKKYKPLSEEETASLFDSDGRLIRENKLRQALFEGIYNSGGAITTGFVDGR